MKIQLKEITIRELTDGFADNGHGKLCQVYNSENF
jgi:hypothetical protein